MGFIFGLLQLLLFAGVGVIAFGFVTYNRLQQLAQEIREAQSNVQVAISKKLTLVNQLIDVVRNFQESEQFTHLKISQDTTIAMAQAYQHSGALMSTILAAADRFPNLKNNEQYHRLIDSIQACEADVQKRRQTYNFHVKMYNSRMLSAPTVLLAKPLGFTVASYLEFEVDSQADATKPKDFQTDDGERLKDMLSKGTEQLGKLGREMAKQTASVGRTAVDLTKGARLDPEPTAATAPSRAFLYIGASGIPAGPASESELFGLLAQGAITAETQMVEVGGTVWKPVGSLLPGSAAH